MFQSSKELEPVSGAAFYQLSYEAIAVGSSPILVGPLTLLPTELWSHSC